MKKTPLKKNTHAFLFIACRFFGGIGVGERYIKRSHEKILFNAIHKTSRRLPVLVGLADWGVNEQGKQ